MKKKLNTSKKTNYLIGVTLVLLGICIGFFVNSLLEAKPASTQDIERAKGEITKLYQGKTVDACWRVNNGANLAAGKYELTYRNLRINKYADRAIVSDCGNFDTLLYKDSSGKWIQSDVNIMIDNRVNPVWQKECGIEDITIADDVVRSENSSIDEMNLADCKKIKQL